MNSRLKGIGASDGIAIAKAFILKQPEFQFNRSVFVSVEDNMQKYEAARIQAVAQLEKIAALTRKKMSEEKAEIFEAHMQLVQDLEIIKEIEAESKNSNDNLALVLDRVYEKYHDIFASMEDEYFKERASDVIDVKKRLLAIILNQPLPDLLSITTACVIVAHDLSPSETAQLDPKFVMGFLTDVGGRTSHAAIMARTLEIPAVLALKNITSFVTQETLLAMDGKTGDVQLNPTFEEQKIWLQKHDAWKKYKKELEQFKDLEPITLDKHKVLIEGNIGHANDLPAVIVSGGRGVGLFRSEFLYMNSPNWPTEEEQFQSYKAALEQMPNDLVIIRTLDIGGDKHLEYFSFPKEMNPFLGYRALRLSLGKKEMFKTQLRALVRASIYGKLGIMFPMVATLDEFLTAKNITLGVIEEMKKLNYQVSDDIKIGMMIEIPTSAVLAATFAKHSDFFSIGSNDLIQYSMAVDRMSEEVNYLYQPNFPGLLMMIKLAIDGAHTHKKEIGMCGEMGGELKSIPLLIGLGMDSLSMSASSILGAKRLIRSLKYQDCVQLAQKALLLETETEVNKLVEQFLLEHNITI